MAKKEKVKEAEDAEKTDTPEGAEGEEGAKKKGLPLKMMLIAGAGAVVLLGGGGTAAFIFLKPKPEAAGEHGDKKDDHGKKKDKKKEEGDHGGGAKDGKPEPGAPVIREGPDGVTFYTLPDQVVNMQTADGKPTFLKLKVTFELPEADMAEELTPNMPRILDMFQTFLRELRPEDIQGSQGTYQLRMEILRRVNLLVAPQKINAVLIEEMLVN